MSSDPPKQPFSWISVVGFFATATIFLPWCIWVLIIERQLYSRLLPALGTLCLWLAIQYFYTGARGWLRHPKSRRAKFTLAGLALCIGFMNLVIVPSILLCFVGCEALQRSRPLREFGVPPRWAQLGAVAACFALLFPGLNAMYLLSGGLKSLAPVVSMTNPLYEINSEGFRGPEIHAQKPDGTLRIAFMGDSTTFGWPYRRQDAYPAVTGALLGEGRSVEVINAAVPGQSLLQMRQRLDAVLAYRPDAATLMFGVHHPGSREQIEDDTDPARFEDHEFEWRFHPPMLVELGLLSALSHPLVLLGLGALDAPEDEEAAAQEDLRVTGEVLDDVLGRLKAASVEVVILEYPSPIVKPEVQELYRQAAERHGASYLALQDAVTAFSFNDGIHPDRAGHRRIAERIAAKLALKLQAAEARPQG